MNNWFFLGRNGWSLLELLPGWPAKWTSVKRRIWSSGQGGEWAQDDGVKSWRKVLSWQQTMNHVRPGDTQNSQPSCPPSAAAPQGCLSSVWTWALWLPLLKRPCSTGRDMLPPTVYSVWRVPDIPINSTSPINQQLLLSIWTQHSAAPWGHGSCPPLAHRQEGPHPASMSFPVSSELHGRCSLQSLSVHSVCRTLLC